MTEIQGTGAPGIRNIPTTPLRPQETPNRAGQESSAPPANPVNLSQAKAPDIDRQNLKLAQNITDKTIAGLKEAQASLGEVAELWRRGEASPENLQKPATQILEAAGTSYKGVQPLIKEQQLTFGPFNLQAFELVGETGVIEMNAILPNQEAPAAINRAWARVEEALGQAEAQRDSIDQKVLSGLPQTEAPPLPAPQSGLHQLPPTGRILELLS